MQFASGGFGVEVRDGIQLQVELCRAAGPLPSVTVAQKKNQQTIFFGQWAPLIGGRCVRFVPHTHTYTHTLGEADTRGDLIITSSTSAMK